MSTQAPLLSIILPAYNEGARLITSINHIDQTLKALHIPYEIIIINDGSTDNTLNQAKIINKSHILVHSYPCNQGKGYAVRTGMRQAQGKYHLFMDVDLSTSLEAIHPFLHELKESAADIIIGNRKTHQRNQMISQPISRQFFGHGFTKLCQWTLGVPIKDFTCGFKMFTQKASQLVFEKQLINNWAFDAEIIFIANKHHLRIIEKPVEWKHANNSKVHLGKDILASLSGLYQIRINDCKGCYR